MQAALHQHSRAAEVERFLDLLEDYFLRQNIPFGMSHGPVECAEAAILRAEVGVVDVAVDDIGNDAFRMPLAPDGIRLHADSDQVIGAEELQRLLTSDHSSR